MKASAPRADHSHLPSVQPLRAALFFATGSLKNKSNLVELQRHTSWICLAVLLQACHEIAFTQMPGIIHRRYYSPLIDICISLLPVLLIVGSFLAMWMACCPTSLWQQGKVVYQRSNTWKRVVLVVTLLMALAGGILCLREVALCFLPAQSGNDGTLLDTNAALQLLAGENPYKAQSLYRLSAHILLHAEWTTPLHQGRFVHRIEYPSKQELQQVLAHDLNTGEAPEFELTTSYPALSFLSLLPFAWFKDYKCPASLPGMSWSADCGCMADGTQ